MKKRVHDIGLYIICSVIFLLLPVLSSPDFPHLGRIIGNPEGKRELVTHFALAVFFYGCYFIVIPRYYFQKRYLLFWSIIAGSFGLFALSILWFGMPPPFHGMPGSADVPGGASMLPPPHRNVLRRLISDYNFFLFAGVFFLAMLLAARRRSHQLQREKLAAELSYLKAQVNPHFLFNTLNSIYALAIEKSDHTAAAVVKLAGMMRYVLTESLHDYVALHKEISYIDEYIGLQRYRIDENVQVQYRLEGNSEGKLIAPFILISFIENAFKYGVSPEDPSAIVIDVRIDAHSLSLYVRNTIVRQPSPPAGSGTGIGNVRNRLKLLYPGRHTLDISADAYIFTIRLTLQL